MNLYVPDFVWQRIDLGTMEKALYGILSRYAGKKDHCWPSQARLAGELGCSVPSVRLYLRALQKAALIHIRRTGNSASTYFLNEAARPATSAPTTTKNFAAGCKDSFGGCKNSLHELYRKKEEKNTSPLSPTSQKPSATPSSVSGRGGGFFPANAAFEDFWRLYPRKEAKELARAVWHRLWRQGALPAVQVLAAAIRAFADSPSWQRECGRYIPQAVNWLRGQRWRDEAVQPVAERHETPNKEALVVQERLEAEEKRRQAAHEKKYRAIKPIFEEFLRAFPDANNAFLRGPAWGMWSYLYEKTGKLLKSGDVHAEQAANGVLEYLRNVKCA